MMNPDLNDQQWQKQRGTRWTEIADDLSGELRRKQLAQIWPMLFEREKGDGGNKVYSLRLL